MMLFKTNPFFSAGFSRWDKGQTCLPRVALSANTRSPVALSNTRVWKTEKRNNLDNCVQANLNCAACSPSPRWWRRRARDFSTVCTLTQPKLNLSLNVILINPLCWANEHTNEPFNLVLLDKKPSKQLVMGVHQSFLIPSENIQCLWGWGNMWPIFPQTTFLPQKCISQN